MLPAATVSLTRLLTLQSKISSQTFMSLQTSLSRVPNRTAQPSLAIHARHFDHLIRPSRARSRPLPAIPESQPDCHVIRIDSAAANTSDARVDGSQLGNNGAVSSIDGRDCLETWIIVLIVFFGAVLVLFLAAWILASVGYLYTRA